MNRFIVQIFRIVLLPWHLRIYAVSYPLPGFIYLYGTCFSVTLSHYHYLVLIVTLQENLEVEIGEICVPFRHFQQDFHDHHVSWSSSLFQNTKQTSANWFVNRRSVVILSSFSQSIKTTTIRCASCKQANVKGHVDGLSRHLPAAQVDEATLQRVPAIETFREPRCWKDLGSC